MKEKIIEILREYSDATTNLLSDLLSESTFKEKLDYCLEADYEYANKIKFWNYFTKKKSKTTRDLLIF